MAKKKKSEQDSVYALKAILYMILGSLWLKVSTDSGLVPIPLGFLFGMLLLTHEHFQIDKKIEFAILLLSMFIGFWLPIGIFINL